MQLSGATMSGEAPFLSDFERTRFAQVPYQNQHLFQANKGK